MRVTIITKVFFVLCLIVSVVFSIEVPEKEYRQIMKRLGNLKNMQDQEELHRNKICLKNNSPCLDIFECCSQNCYYGEDSLYGSCKPHKFSYKHFDYYNAGRVYN